VYKYGIENFKFNILIFCFDEDRYKYEIEYIQKYNSLIPNGYNISKGGTGGGFYGKKHSLESIQKITTSMKNISKLTNNQPTFYSQEYKHKMSITLSNSSHIKYLKEHKLSFSALKTKVAQYDFKNNLIATYESLTEASNKTNIHYKNISKAINGNTKTSGGFIWRKIL